MFYVIIYWVICIFSYIVVINITVIAKQHLIQHLTHMLSMIQMWPWAKAINFTYFLYNLVHFLRIVSRVTKLFLLEIFIYMRAEVFLLNLYNSFFSVLLEDYVLVAFSLCIWPESCLRSVAIFITFTRDILLVIELIFTTLRVYIEGYL